MTLKTAAGIPCVGKTVVEDSDSSAEYLGALFTCEP